MAAQLLVDHFSALGSFQQLLLLAVLASLAFFSLLVLLHLDGSAIGASRARPDLEVVPVAWPLIGNLLRELQPEMGDRGLEGMLRRIQAESGEHESLLQLGYDCDERRRTRPRASPSRSQACESLTAPVKPLSSTFDVAISATTSRERALAT